MSEGAQLTASALLLPLALHRSAACWLSQVLVKVHPEGKYVVDIDKNIDITKLNVNDRVALRNDSYQLHLVLPSKVDPVCIGSQAATRQITQSTHQPTCGMHMGGTAVRCK